jgi:ABC-type phosphate transport system permease subunit
VAGLRTRPSIVPTPELWAEVEAAKNANPATALPVQIFLWADSPERAFLERTSAAIIVLLAFLIVMNATAVILRNRYERRW